MIERHHLEAIANLISSFRYCQLLSGKWALCKDQEVITERDTKAQLIKYVLEGYYSTDDAQLMLNKDYYELRGTEIRIFIKYKGE